MAELRRDEPLFDRLLPIHINYGGASHNLPSHLIFRILRGSQPAQAMGQSEAVYHFEISDDRDPYFLYYFEVGEGDFPQFKREQSILVEFHAVPVKLMELLEHCLRSAGMLEAAETSQSAFASTTNTATLANNNDKNSGASNLLSSSHLPLSSTYSAELDTSTGIFSIVEANQFNKLVHIKIPLQLGDDAAIKLYLASRLALALSQTRRLRGELSGLERRRDDDAYVLEQQRVELSELRSQRHVDIQSLRATHSEELSNTQRLHLETIEELRARHEETVTQLKQQVDLSQKELHDKSLSLQRQIADLEHDKSQLDFKQHDLTRLLSVAETDRDRLMKECEDLHGRRRLLEEERTSLLREVAKQEARLDGLTTQLGERDTSMQKSLLLQKAAEEARLAVEDRLKLELQRGEEMNNQMIAMQSEAERFQNLASRLQTDNRALKDRFRDKNEVLRKQEMVVTDLRLRLSELESQLSRESESKRLLQQEHEKTLARVQELQENLASALENIESSKKVCGFLSSEISRLQMGQRIAAEPALYSSPSSYNTNNNNTNTNFDKMVSTPAYSSSGDYAVTSTPDTVLRRYSTPLHSNNSNYNMGSSNNNYNSSYTNNAVTSRANSTANTNAMNNTASPATASYLERGARRLGLEQDLRLAVAELDLDSSSPSSEEHSLLRQPGLRNANMKKNNLSGGSAVGASSALGLRREVDIDQLDYYNTATVK